MHEMALVRNVVDIVVEQAEAAGTGTVRAVYLTIGYGRDIVEEYFDGLFEYLARGTVAEHAELIIKRVPTTVRCNQCGLVFRIDFRNTETWVCPSCTAEKDYKLNSGMEFLVNRIEVEAASAEEQAPQPAGRETPALACG